MFILQQYDRMTRVKVSATAASVLLQLLWSTEEKEMNDFYFCPSKD